MFKRILLALTFATAFGAAGLCLTDNADARGWRWGRPYASYYYGPPAYYTYGAPYRAYYPGYVVRRPYYYSYGYPGYYYRPIVPRVAVRIGW
jgi:hypothetical protein